MSIGLRQGTVKIEVYDPNWPAEFEQEKQRLLDVFGDRVVDIKHIGSTSIPGLAAKPIIDMVMAVRSFDDLQLIDELQKLGYEYMPERMSDNRKFFPKGPRALRTHHLNVVIENNYEQWVKPLIFRDYLRSHPTDLAEYQKLKSALAELYASDRETYTRLKDDFFQSIFQKAIPK